MANFQLVPIGRNVSKKTEPKVKDRFQQEIGTKEKVTYPTPKAKRQRVSKKKYPKFGYCRYADDFIVTAENEEDLIEILPIIKEWLSKRGLQINEEKTKIVNAKDGFNFLGFHIRKFHNRHLPNGAILKQLQLIKKSDGWFVNLRLEASTVPICSDDIIPTWDNSLGMDAVLHEDDYLATSEVVKLPSIKVLRKSQHKLNRISTKKNARAPRSKARRKLAKREGKQHQKIARCRKDFHYKTAHKLVRTGKKSFLS
jgi:hypothetical protein